MHSIYFQQVEIMVRREVAVFIAKCWWIAQYSCEEEFDRHRLKTKVNAQHTVNVTNDFGDDKVWLPLLKIGFVYGLV